MVITMQSQIAFLLAVVKDIWTVKLLEMCTADWSRSESVKFHAVGNKL